MELSSAYNLKQHLITDSTGINATMMVHVLCFSASSVNEHIGITQITFPNHIRHLVFKLQEQWGVNFIEFHPPPNYSWYPSMSWLPQLNVSSTTRVLEVHNAWGSFCRLIMPDTKHLASVDHGWEGRKGSSLFNESNRNNFRQMQCSTWYRNAI